MAEIDLLEIDHPTDDRGGRIVVGIDGTDDSLAALRWALHRPVAVGSRVEVVHIWHRGHVIDALFASDQELHNGSTCMVANEVAAALAPMPERPRVVETSRKGWPEVALLHRANDAELLVLGAHASTDLHDRVFSKVAAHCVTRATGPVVIVDRDQQVTTHHPERARARASWS